MALVLLVVGVGSLFSHRESSKLVAAIMLLNAWDMAFMPSLPLNLRLGEIYDRARQGWRMPWISRAIGWVTIVVAIYAAYLQFHGR